MRPQKPTRIKPGDRVRIVNRVAIGANSRAIVGQEGKVTGIESDAYTDEYVCKIELDGGQTVEVGSYSVEKIIY